MNNTKRAIVAGSVAALLVLFAVFFFSGGNKDSAAVNEKILRQRIASSYSDPTSELSVLAAESKISYARVLSDFKDWSKYPQDSRPYAPEDSDIVNFDKLELPMMPMTLVDKDKPKEALHVCVLQPNAHTVYEGQQLEIHLRCQDIASGNPAMAEVKLVKLTRTSGVSVFDIPSPDISRNEKGQPSILFTFKPRKQDWGDMELTVDFTIPNDKPTTTHRQRVHFFSSPDAPAKFTGNFRERLENGSLVISVELQVRLPGSYRIEGNLTSQSGEPIAHARVDADMTGGNQWADLLFFGKIFRDKAIPSPFKLAAVYGAQQNLPINPDALTGPPDQVAKLLANTEQTEPIKRSVLPWIAGYNTLVYPLTAFSKDEFDSPFKRERISELESLAKGQ